MLDALVSALIGFGSGVLSGMFGIGGGIITTPAIRLVLGAPALVAVGTPLPVIVPGAISGALTYWRNGSSDPRAGLVLGLAGSVTAVAGAWLATRMGGTVVLLGTAALIFYAAGDTLMQIRRPPAVALDADGVPVAPAAWRLVLIGLLTGAYSGFFGLGGGFVLVPMLTRWTGFSVKRAVGTSLMTVAIIAVPGTVTHAVLGNVDWSIALGLAVGVIPGAVAGAHLALRSSDARIRIGFAALLVAAGAWLALSEIAGLMP